METIRVIEIKKQVKRLPRTKVPGGVSKETGLRWEGKKGEKKGKKKKR